jgi:hypothetical protein
MTMSTMQCERQFLETHGLTVHPLNEIIRMASEILGPDDELLRLGYLEGNLHDVVVPLSLLDRCERALAVPSLTKELRERLFERETRPKWEQLDYVFGDDEQFHALALCFPKYWARSGVRDEVKQNLARLVLMRQRVVDRIA